jgi:hypothetical protein
MTERVALFLRRGALLLLVSIVFPLANCRRQSGERGPLYIMLTYNGGACEQNGSEGIIDIYQDQPVVYQTAAELTQFKVQFTACPFASCPVNSPHGTSVNVGAPNAGMAGTTFNYSGMSMNNEQCKDAASMGVHVSPGR